MDSEETCDLDTLADLLDEEENNISKLSETPLSGSEPSISSAVVHMPTTLADRFQITTNVTNGIKSDSKASSKQLKTASVDLFSTVSSPCNTRHLDGNSKDSRLETHIHTLDTDSSEDENKSYLTESGKAIKRKLMLRKSFEEKPQQRVKTWKDKEIKPDVKKTLNSAAKESYMVEEFSGIRIVNPLVPHDVMKTRMCQRRMIKMSFIHNFIKNGDIEGDWVTIGVLVNKLPPKTSKNGKTFSIWKMTDLHDTEKIVSVFLFGSVHTEHWKTAVGTVVGILNPSILPNKNGSAYAEISLSVDHAGKFMIIGTSKDFGYCKGKRKDSLPCTSVVNKSQCEYCIYHVSKEYKKFCAKRVELQASYSGGQPKLKSKVLKGQNIMYGGQLFSAPSGKITSNSRSAKDKLRLNNLSLKRKAQELESIERSHIMKKTTDVYSIEANKEIMSKSPFINQKLSVTTAGSKNLFQHLKQKEKVDIVKRQVISVTPKDLLKMHQQELRAKRENLSLKTDVQSIENIVPIAYALTPQIGRGFKPGDEICLDVKSPMLRRALSVQDLAKVRAIQKIKEKGSLKQQDPNAVKNEKTPESAAKIQLSLKNDIEVPKQEEEEESVLSKQGVKTGLLGSINLSSEKINQILNKKSNHSYEVEMEEIERQEMYFRALEKKEQMELKMLSTTEVVCDVVSCKVCKYTAHKSTDLCKAENHPLRIHKAVKRFFSCTNCQHRTYAFTKLPTRPCRNCGESNFERTSMIKPRSGPKLESEILSIRGDEIKFLNNLKK